MPNNSAEKFVDNHNVEKDARSLFTADGFDRFKTYIDLVSKGQPKIYDAPFAKGQSMRRVLADWDKTLVSIKTTWPSLYEFEVDLAKKVGPMSVQLPIWERIPDVEHYYEDILLSSKPIDPVAMKQVIIEFSMSGALRLRSQKDTVDRMKKSTSAGAPFMGKRKDRVSETIPCNAAIRLGRHPDSYIKLRTWEGQTAAILGWRGQEGGPSEEDVKQRVIWMFPFSVNINELQVYQPLIESLQASKSVPAWVSMDEVDRRVTALFDTKAKDDLVVCTDFSRFDQHFNADMQDCARTILRGLLANGKVSEDWLRNVFPIKYSIPLAWAANTDEEFGYKTVSCFEGPHGMASGSGGTNADETLAHRALQYEVANLHAAKLNPNSQCLGDDGVLSYPGITVEDVVESYQSHGQECNPDKQYASTQDCVYLRRWHHNDYRIDGVCAGVYSTNRALGRLRYLERFMDPKYWSRELVALRQLSIIENCKYHPLRDEFAQFCMKRDKYRLGLDIPGFMDNLPKLATEATGHIQDFLGYTKTLQGEGPEGISNWWIVQYLKSAR